MSIGHAPHQKKKKTIVNIGTRLEGFLCLVRGGYFKEGHSRQGGADFKQSHGDDGTVKIVKSKIG